MDSVEAWLVDMEKLGHIVVVVSPSLLVVKSKELESEKEAGVDKRGSLLIMVVCGSGFVG